MALSFVHVFNPTLVLNLKAGYTRLSIRSLPINNNTNVSNKLGFACSSTPNALSSAGNCINGAGLAFGTGLAVVTPTNYQVLGDSPFVPLLEFDNNFQYSGQLVWTKGSHSIKLGVSLIRRRAAIGQSPSPNGAFGFTGNLYWRTSWRSSRRARTGWRVRRRTTTRRFAAIRCGRASTNSGSRRSTFRMTGTRNAGSL